MLSEADDVALSTAKMIANTASRFNVLLKQLGYGLRKYKHERRRFGDADSGLISGRDWEFCRW